MMMCPSYPFHTVNTTAKTTTKAFKCRVPDRAFFMQNSQNFFYHTLKRFFCLIPQRNQFLEVQFNFSIQIFP